MYRFDHFIVNINEKYQKNKSVINNIIDAGFPYKSSWGKGTRGFKASNLWIGNEYFEMINILKRNGGGWKAEWVDLYNKGHRGLICLMLNVEDIDKFYDLMTSKNINITKPEHLKYKWFFNLFTKVMPWRISYSDFFEGIQLQLGFIQMDDEKSVEFMKQYMVPNSRDNKINGISKVIIKGNLSDNDKKLISEIFEVETKEPIKIELNKNQILIFEESDNYSVDVVTDCNNEIYDNKTLCIENINIKNRG